MTTTMLLAVIVTGLTFSSAHSQSYHYVNPVNERHTISIQRSPALFISGDRAIDAKFCSPTDRFVCVSSDDFNFAFPIGRASDLKKWEHQGYVYELRGRETMQIFGHSWRVWIVESTQGVKTMRYAYSDQRGVLAFSARLSDTASTFLSVGTVGFGALPRRQVLQR
jgi:hypothetical protein